MCPTPANSQKPFKSACLRRLARMPHGLNPLIISAIQERRVLSLVYKGRPVDVESYTYGQMLAGNEFLYGWQRSGAFSNWRFFWLHLSRDIRLSDVAFEAP